MLDPDTMDRCAADGKSSNGSLRGVVGISVDDVSVAESAGGESAQVSRIDSEAIIGRVRYLMGLKRLSQRRLAALLRIDASNLSKVLNGKLPFPKGLSTALWPIWGCRNRGFAMVWDCRLTNSR